MFSSEIYEIFKKNFFYRTPPVATSETKHINPFSTGKIEKLDFWDFEIFESRSVLWPAQRGTGSERVNASAANLSHIRIGNIDWNESHDEETKHIHVQLSIFYILE